jgi:hypothetical protein
VNRFDGRSGALKARMAHFRSVAHPILKGAGFGRSALGFSRHHRTGERAMTRSHTRTLRRLYLSLLLAIAFTACGQGGGSTTTGPTETNTDNGAGLCAQPEFLVTPRFLPEDANHTDVIRQTVVDGDHLFFTTLYTAYRVPLAGGEPVKLDVNHGGTIFKAAGKVFLVYFGYPNTVHELSRSGSQAALLPVALPPQGGVGAVSPSTPLWMDETHLYYESRTSNPVGDGTFAAIMTYSLHRVPWAGGAPEKLADLGRSRVGTFRKQGDRLYFRIETDALTSDAPDTLVSMPAAGGTPVKLRAVEGNEQFLALDGSSIYLSFMTDPAHYVMGAGRMPLTGGDPVPFHPRNIDHLWLDGGRMVFTQFEQVKKSEDLLADWAMGVYTLVPGGTAAYAGCIQKGLTAKDFTVHDADYSGKFLYVSVDDNSTDQYGILKFPVP